MDYIFFSHFLLILDFRLYQVAFNETLCQEDPRELQCLGAILYNVLELYFTSVAFEDSTHTNNAILASLNNKFVEAYLEFMDYNLGRFVSFNLLFQSEMPQLHLLK